MLSVALPSGHILRHAVPAVLLAMLVVLPLAACGGNSRPNGPRTVSPNISGGTPAALRGTILGTTRLRGVLPARISGFGFVVGLNGTGGLPVNEEVAATIERMMLLRGVGQTGAYEGYSIEGTTPRELLRDRNTAVVVVEAAAPPGGLTNDSFDVYVRALNATSLEGGRLWSTELRAGPPTLFGQQQSQLVAEAAGPIFINPFAEPNSPMGGVSQTIGRVLGGGVMMSDLQIEVVLNRPSHGQARLITNAINSAYPQGPFDQDRIARGRDESLVVVRVPREYSGRRDRFLQLLRHTLLDQSYPEIHARRFATQMQRNPELASAYGWALEALGERALPFVRELYDVPTQATRLRALRTGAHLGDPQAAGPLLRMATEGPEGLRSEAIRLLESVDAGARIELGLAGLLNDPLITARIAAYETLTERGIARRREQLRLYDESRPNGAQVRLSLSTIETLSRLHVPNGTIFGVSRSLASGKFFLDRIPEGRPLIYITQQDEPRLALFGEGPWFEDAFSAVIWSDRFLLVRDEPGGPIRLSYRRSESGRATILNDVPEDLGEFIEMLAYNPTPERPQPGLDMTYSEIIGVLYQLNQAGVIKAAFTTELDRLQEELREAAGQAEVELRPETPDDEQTVIIRGYDDPGQELTPTPQQQPESLLVPLGPAQGEEPAGENSDGSSD